MLTMCHDIILKISESLTDCEKIYLTAATKILNGLKYKMRFYEKIHVDRIIDLLYFDNFENVEISSAERTCPKFVKHIHYLAETADIPPFVTHLKFHRNFNRQIKGYIPPSVTHLMFGM